MEKEELNNQELWDKFISQLEKFKDTKVILKAEERIVAYYQTTESPKLEFEEGETALSPQEYAEEEGVDHESWGIDSIINPKTVIQNDDYIINYVEGEFLLDSILEALKNYEFEEHDSHGGFYAEDYFNDAIRDEYTAPELLEERGMNITKNLKVEGYTDDSGNTKNDIEVTWLNYESTDQFDLTILLSQEVVDFIEKFQEENS